jgi:glycosyltransferase involved in cell wall biosynthesis
MVGVPFFHTEEIWADRKIHKSMLETCDAIVANTAYEADFISRRAQTGVKVAGVGIHPEAFEQRNGDEIRRRYGLGSSPVVGFVGRLIPRKGAIALLQAMRTVWAWNPKVRLVLAGSAPPGVSEVEDVIQRFTPDERRRIIRIPEFREREKASIYDAFDVFVLPSTSESFGIVYLEAWACEKPVIGACIGSTQSVIREGEDGLLVNPQNPLGIADAIVSLLSDPGERERLGKNGKAKAITQFTWEKITDKVEQLYLELYTAKVSRSLPPLRTQRQIDPRTTVGSQPVSH